MGIFLQSYLEHFVASAVVFLLLFGAIAYLIAGKRFIQMLGGFGGVIFSFFRSPFSYLRAAVLSMADYGAKGETESSSSKQYLLKKLMLFMQAVLVVLSIAVFAGSITTGWNAMLPPKPLRDAVSELNKMVAQKNADLKKFEPALKQMDETWKSQAEVQIGNFTTERTKKIEQLGKDNTQVAKRINDLDPQTKMLFVKIQQFHAKNVNNSSISELENSISTLNAYLNRMSMTSDAQALIKTYNDNWGMQLRSKIEIIKLSPKEVRAIIQPTYETMSTQLAEIQRVLPIQEKQLASLKALVRYNVKSLFLNILSGALIFILLVWIFGLLIEVLWSAINISSDVKKLQETLSKPIN